MILRLGLLALCLVFAGCGAVEEKPNREVLPSFLSLENQEDLEVGRAIAVDDFVFLTADHLLVQHETLFWNDQPITILARDFEHDLLLFELSGVSSPVVVFEDTPPAVGETLYWVGDKRLAEGRVSALGEDLVFDDLKRTNLVVLDSAAVDILPGSIVFDDLGQIYGMIIAGDHSLGKVFVVRSDLVEVFVGDNLR